VSRTLKITSALIALVLALGACSGGGDDTTDSSAPSPETSTTTTPPTSTTRPPATTPATTTTTQPLPTTPLNGLPVFDPAAPGRPALVVKIDNVPRSRPPSGLDVADIVYEENVEGWTRFAAVFHSLVPEPVGPVRSGRTQDIDLLTSLDRPLFVWSGGNARVTSAIRESTLIDMGPSGLKGVDYYRSSDRPAPHNLFARVADAWAANVAGSPPPPPQLTFRPAGEPADGDAPVVGVKLEMDGGMRAEWRWDASVGRFLRFHDGGRPHEVAGGGQVQAENVVVLTVQYRPSPADARSPEAVTVGEGDALVFTDGQVLLARWVRPDNTSPWTFLDAAGAEIGLTPGRTWVELTRGNQAAVVPEGVDPSDVAWP
jgi:hypothetical protein